jgi:hypothetical protein
MISDKSGFGKVYEAYERSTPKILKVLKENHNNNQKAVELFQQEALVLSQLQHRGIPLIEPNGYFQFASRNGSCILHCIVMEKIDGPNLREWMRQQGNNPISEKQTLNWLKQIAEILHLVHQKNYFHRDIKPENIMLRSNGQLVLVDFGAAREMTYTYLAQLSGGPSGVTRISSAGYTPPEQEYGQAVPQSDFYALGRTFVYLLTGKLPTDVEVYDSLNNEFKWRTYAPHISKPLANFIDQLIAPRAADRPKNTSELLAGINLLTNSLAIAAATNPSPASTVVEDATVRQASRALGHLARKQRWLLAGVAGLAIALGGVGWRLTHHSETPLPTTTTEELSVIETLTGHTAEVKCLIFGPGNTDVMISGGVDATIRIWNITTGQLQRTISGHNSYINTLMLSPDGKSLISGSADKTIRLWDFASAKLIRQFQDSGFVNTLDLSPDGKLLVSGNADGIIRLWDLTTGRELKHWAGHTSPINALMFTPDGKDLLTGSADNTIKLWDLQTQQAIRTFTGHTSYVNAIAISPDGQWLISGSADNTIKIWNLQTGEMLHTLTGHQSYVNALEVSVDGKTLLSSSADGTIKVWDLQTGQLHRTLLGYNAPINFFAVDFDRQIMATGSKSKDIKIWRFQP